MNRQHLHRNSPQFSPVFLVLLFFVFSLLRTRPVLRPGALFEKEQILTGLPGTISILPVPRPGPFPPRPGPALLRSRLPVSVLPVPRLRSIPRPLLRLHFGVDNTLASSRVLGWLGRFRPRPGWRGQVCVIFCSHLWLEPLFSEDIALDPLFSGDLALDPLFSGDLALDPLPPGLLSLDPLPPCSISWTTSTLFCTVFWGLESSPASICTNSVSTHSSTSISAFTATCLNPGAAQSSILCCRASRFARICFWYKISNLFPKCQ